MGHGVARIRPATPADIPAMLRMGRDFVDTGVGVPFDPAFAEAALRAHLAEPGRLSLLLDIDGCVGGMLCAAAVASPLAPVRLAQELVFWIDPDARGPWAMRMIRDYEYWAAEQGCAVAALVARPGSPAGRLYLRRGYALAETHYAKDL